MLDRWLDRDDITAEDLDEMTAEEEVLDWMVGSPLPAARRPEWLPEEHWSAPSQRRPPGVLRAQMPPVWPLVLAGFVMVTGLGLFFGAAALAGVAWWLV